MSDTFHYCKCGYDPEPKFTDKFWEERERPADEERTLFKHDMMTWCTNCDCEVGTETIEYGMDDCPF